MTERPITWRTILEEALKDPHQRERLASWLNVSPAALVRWSREDARPDKAMLRRLPDALPEYALILQELIAREM